MSLASPSVYPVMVIVSATMPVCPGLDTLKTGVFVPYPSALQQVGTPAVTAVSSDALVNAPATRGGAGAVTAGCTGPPMTRPTVFTAVLGTAWRCAANQVVNWVNNSGVMDTVGSQFVEPGSHTWWKVRIIQPPPWVSALVTVFCRSVNVQVASTLAGARSA